MSHSSKYNSRKVSQMWEQRKVIDHVKSGVSAGVHNNFIFLNYLLHLLKLAAQKANTMSGLMIGNKQTRGREMSDILKVKSNIIFQFLSF